MGSELPNPWRELTEPQEGERRGPSGLNSPLPTLLGAGATGDQANKGGSVFTREECSLLPFSPCRQQRRQTDKSRWALFGEIHPPPKKCQELEWKSGQLSWDVQVKSLGETKPRRSRFSQRSLELPCPFANPWRGKDEDLAGIPRSVRPKVAGRLSRGRSGECRDQDPRENRECRGMRRTEQPRGESRAGKGGGAGGAVSEDETGTRPHTRLSREMNPEPAKSKPGNIRAGRRVSFQGNGESLMLPPSATVMPGCSQSALRDGKIKNNKKIAIKYV